MARATRKSKRSAPDTADATPYAYASSERAEVDLRQSHLHCTIEGLEAEEADTLLQHLYHQAWIPDYQCRFRWRPDSLAFWDNRAAQHYAAADYWPDVRKMERVTIIGDKPR